MGHYVESAVDAGYSPPSLELPRSVIAGDSHWIFIGRVSVLHHRYSADDS